MRIATLQFDALLGDVEGNISKASELLACQRDIHQNLDLLVLPELAFSGYNHSSYADVEPYLEPTSAGPSTRWAQRTAKWLQCVVAVGYPEKDVSTTPVRAYNSLVFVNGLGEIIAHTRKSFLYYTDETWALEGQGFFAGELLLGSFSETKMKVAAGICMDINPYKFQAPWTAFEFAHHALDSRAEIVVLSMAWLTRLSTSDLQMQSKQADLDTVGYWLERLRPLRGPNGNVQELIVIFANRCGEEGEAPLIGPVRYAGSSTVMGICRGDGRLNGEVCIWEMLGRAEEGVLVVDTKSSPKYRLRESLLAEDEKDDNPPEPSNHE